MDESANERSVKVSAAIIVQDGRVLACKRREGDAGGGWEFPGGKLEGGESGVDACRREIDEELGVRLSTTWLLDTVEHDYPDFHLSMDCFVCMMLPGQVPEPRAHSELRWLSQDDLADLTWLPADRKVVEILGRYWDQLFASEHL